MMFSHSNTLPKYLRDMTAKDIGTTERLQRTTHIYPSNPLKDEQYSFFWKGVPHSHISFNAVNAVNALLVLINRKWYASVDV